MNPLRLDEPGFVVNVQSRLWCERCDAQVIEWGRMKRKRWLIVPGTIISKRDGDLHYISAEDLMWLYRVNPAECVVHNERMGPYRGATTDRLWVLRPRFDGDYLEYKQTLLAMEGQEE